MLELKLKRIGKKVYRAFIVSVGVLVLFSFVSLYWYSVLGALL